MRSAVFPHDQYSPAEFVMLYKNLCNIGMFFCFPLEKTRGKYYYLYVDIFLEKNRREYYNE